MRSDCTVLFFFVVLKSAELGLKKSNSFMVTELSV